MVDYIKASTGWEIQHVKRYPDVMLNPKFWAAMRATSEEAYKVLIEGTPIIMAHLTGVKNHAQPEVASAALAMSVAVASSVVPRGTDVLDWWAGLRGELVSKGLGEGMSDAEISATIKILESFHGPASFIPRGVWPSFATAMIPMLQKPLAKGFQGVSKCVNDMLAAFGCDQEGIESVLSGDVKHIDFSPSVKAIRSIESVSPMLWDTIGSMMGYTGGWRISCVNGMPGVSANIVPILKEMGADPLGLVLTPNDKESHASSITQFAMASPTAWFAASALSLAMTGGTESETAHWGAPSDGGDPCGEA